MRVLILGWCCVCSLLVSPAYAADDLLHIQRCRRTAVSPAATGDVTLRLWPFRASRESLSAENVAFASVISDHDIVAIAGSHLIVRRVDESPTSLIVSQNTPDTFIFGRDGDVTIFPRILLLTPRVSFAAVRRDDFIASIFVTAHKVGEGKYLEKADEQDRLRLLLPIQDKTRPMVVSVLGPLLASDQHGRIQLKPRCPSLSSFWDDFEYGGRIENEIAARMASHLTSQCPVCVVHRVDRGLKIRYVVPLRQTGVFSVQSDVIGKIASSGDKPITDPNRINAWNRLFGSALGDIQLRDDDVLEYTLIDLVPPFHQAALP